MTTNIEGDLADAVHAPRHASAGEDAIAPGDIGAATVASVEAIQATVAGLGATAWQANTAYAAEKIVSNGVGLYEAPSGGAPSRATFTPSDWDHLADIALPVGTTSGTVAAGDDARITGAAQKANNGSDFADAGSTRANIHVPVLTSCQAVATANLTLSGIQTVDGYTPQIGDQILAAGQTTGSQGGPWVVALGAWSRPTDYAHGASVKGRQIQVNNGTIYDNTIWVMATGTSVIVDTTPTTWTVASQPFNDGRYVRPNTNVGTWVVPGSAMAFMPASGVTITLANITLTNGSAKGTCSAPVTPAGLVVGLAVTDSGGLLPGGTTIVGMAAGNSTGSITFSNPATGSGVVTLSFVVDQNFAAVYNVVQEAATASYTSGSSRNFAGGTIVLPAGSYLFPNGFPSLLGGQDPLGQGQGFKAIEPSSGYVGPNVFAAFIKTGARSVCRGVVFFGNNTAMEPAAFTAAACTISGSVVTAGSGTPFSSVQRGMTVTDSVGLITTPNTYVISATPTALTLSSAPTAGTTNITVTAQTAPGASRTRGVQRGSYVDIEHCDVSGFYIAESSISNHIHTSDSILTGFIGSAWEQYGPNAPGGGGGAGQSGGDNHHNVQPSFSYLCSALVTGQQTLIGEWNGGRSHWGGVYGMIACDYLDDLQNGGSGYPANMQMQVASYTSGSVQIAGLRLDPANTGCWNGMALHVVSGTGSGQVGQITATAPYGTGGGIVLTLASPLGTPLDATSVVELGFTGTLSTKALTFANGVTVPTQTSDPCVPAASVGGRLGSLNVVIIAGTGAGAALYPVSTMTGNNVVNLNSAPASFDSTSVFQFVRGGPAMQSFQTGDFPVEGPINGILWDASYHSSTPTASTSHWKLQAGTSDSPSWVAPGLPSTNAVDVTELQYFTWDISSAPGWPATKWRNSLGGGFFHFRSAYGGGPGAMTIATTGNGHQITPDWFSPDTNMVGVGYVNGPSLTSPNGPSGMIWGLSGTVQGGEPLGFVSGSNRLVARWAPGMSWAGIAGLGLTSASQTGGQLVVYNSGYIAQNIAQLSGTITPGAELAPVVGTPGSLATVTGTGWTSPTVATAVSVSQLLLHAPTNGILGTGALQAAVAAQVAPYIVLPTTLSSALSTGSPITSIPINALGFPVASGTFTINDLAGHTQVVTLSGAVAQGATALPVNSFTPTFAFPSGTTFVIPATIHIPVPVGAGHLDLEEVAGGGSGPGAGSAAASGSPTATQVGGSGAGSGATAKAVVAVTAGDTVTITVSGNMPAPGAGAVASVGTTGNPGNNGGNGTQVTTSGTGFSVTAYGGRLGSASAANSAATVNGGAYGGGFGSIGAATSGLPGGGGSATSATGNPGGPQVGLSPRGGCAGGPASALLGGGAGGDTSGAAAASSTTSGLSPTTTPAPGQGGDAGGGGAPGGAGGNGGRGGTIMVALKWLP